MAITVGDTVYILKERLDFTLMQFEVEVTEIQLLRLFGKPNLFYTTKMENGEHICSWRSNTIGIKKRVVIRNRPFPNIPIYRGT